MTRFMSVVNDSEGDKVPRIVTPWSSKHLLRENRAHPGWCGGCDRTFKIQDVYIVPMGEDVLVTN